MAELMRQYRDALTGIVRDSQRRRTTTAGADPAGLGRCLQPRGTACSCTAGSTQELDSAAAPLIALWDLLTG